MTSVPPAAVSFQSCEPAIVMLKRGRFRTRDPITGDTSAAGSRDGGSARTVPGSSKKSQLSDGASGSSQTTLTPRLLPPSATCVAANLPGMSRAALPSSRIEPSGAVWVTVADSSSHLPLPCPAICSPRGNPGRPRVALVAGLPSARNVSSSRSLPQLAGGSGGHRVSLSVTVAVAARSFALRSSSIGRACAAPGATSATKAVKSRVEVERRTRVRSQYRLAAATTLELVPEPVVREIPIADTRPLRQAILRPHQTLEDLAGHEPPDAFAVGAFLDDRLVAVGFVAPDGEPGAWRVRGMATVPEARGRGAGRAVLDALVTHARGRGATRLWCNARTPARSLYERAGFAVASDEFELPQIGPHFLMERNIAAAGCWDR